MLDLHFESLVIGVAFGLGAGLSLAIPSIQRHRRKIRQTQLTRNQLNKELQEVATERIEAFDRGWERGRRGAPKYEIVK